MLYNDWLGSKVWRMNMKQGTSIDGSTQGVDLQRFYCPNGNCSQHGVRGKRNIGIRSVNGKNNIRLLYCRVCKKTFSERCGTILGDSRLLLFHSMFPVFMVDKTGGLTDTDFLSKIGCSWSMANVGKCY